MALQLQANSQNQLTAADVEVIVRRILGAELAALRTSMDTDKKEAYTSQVSYSFYIAVDQHRIYVSSHFYSVELEDYIHWIGLKCTHMHMLPLYMGLKVRKPVFGVCKQQRCRPVCADTYQHLCYLFFLESIIS